MEIAARARLRPNKDEDLIEAWKRLPPHEDKSDIVRKALRLLFFGDIKSVASRNEHLAQSNTIENHMAENDENISDQDFSGEELLQELLDSF